MIARILNVALRSDALRMFILLVSSVMIGYTLQPVPKWLDQYFDHSNILKFLILMGVGLTAVYPLNNSEVILVAALSILVLALFSWFRKIDAPKPDTEKEKVPEKTVQTVTYEYKAELVPGNHPATMDATLFYPKYLRPQ